MRWLFLCSFSLGLLAAQNVRTWGGLTFGMTEGQVRTVLGSRMLKPGPNDQPAGESSRQFTGGLVIENAIDGFSGQATLLFDKESKKLSAITLFLTPLKDSNGQRQVVCICAAPGGPSKKVRRAR